MWTVWKSQAPNPFNMQELSFFYLWWLSSVSKVYMLAGIFKRKLRPRCGIVLGPSRIFYHFPRQSPPDGHVIRQQADLPPLLSWVQGPVGYWKHTAYLTHADHEQGATEAFADVVLKTCAAAQVHIGTELELLVRMRDANREYEKVGAPFIHQPADEGVTFWHKL